ncbi:UDP-N-acetylmuramoyl-tripeptide--D-alanyl-D-alanine ligase [Halobacillus massiliensis]|uniref:UDP-N-acetylmuramoyl-tripeptide--D-alanyl-D- alanine ligase n=1 Tax=Halobacillus massiliensis TaxID=1926286 RepID=UPI0009E1FC6B|nr:UDP-N-acetylmuramoyl-tripeptide--D-alanyl-D-alanine ligase [Halobacillus massiliensis]
MFTVQELSAVFSDHRGAANDKIPLRAVMTDTRIEKKQSLFIPLAGENFDAHLFLMDAIKNGAVAALWQKDRELPKAVPTEFPVFFVEDTLQALQETSSFYLNKVKPIVVGITGSNGKTTTKDLVASVLQVKYRTHKTAGNFNNHIGLPLTILSMPEDTEVAVLEMGMSQAGEISLLSKLARPSYAIITNIGESHIEFLGSRKGIAEAKLEILDGWQEGAFIYDGDEELLKDHPLKAHAISSGFNQGCTQLIEQVDEQDDDSYFTINQIRYHLPLSGKHNVKNASYAIALALKLNMSSEEIQKGLENLQLSGMRYEKLEGLHGSLIINDAYNASPTSMKAVIEVILHLKAKKKKVLVLGDMFELGKFSGDLHADVASVITSEIDAVYTIGENASRITEAVQKSNKGIRSQHFTNKQSLSDQVKTELTPDTVVLIKASRGMKLEELIKDLINND